jgi:hypothetical protein
LVAESVSEVLIYNPSDELVSNSPLGFVVAWEKREVASQAPMIGDAEFGDPLFDPAGLDSQVELEFSVPAVWVSDDFGCLASPASR